MPRTTIAIALAAVLLAACGSSGSTQSSASSSSTASSTSGGSTAAAPPVVNATDMKTKPVPGKGTEPAPTTLVIKDLVVGTGAEAQASSTVTVQYVGTNYADGKEFDSSWAHGQPAVFPLNGVIPGFARGIVGMKVGGRRELVIPPALGYGAQGNGPVGPNETLVFVIDLLAVQ